MKLYLTLALSLIGIKVMACSCSVMPDIKTKEDVDSHSFIALVKITRLPLVDPKSMGFKLRINGDIGIEIKEQFKGEITTKAFDQSFNNDCNLQVHVGEQWLFFGNVVNGKLVVGSCDRNQRYRDSTGMRGWFNGEWGSDKHLDQLRQFYGHPLVSNATAKVLYTNGNIEIEQSFKAGKLNGARKVYYPNGKIYMKELFKNGERIGNKDVYFPDGQLKTHEEYKNGFVKQTVLYHDTAEIVWYLNFQATRPPLFGDDTRSPEQIRERLDSLRKAPNWGKQIQSIYEYSDDGRSYTRKFYTLDGKLDAETYLDWAKKVTEHKMYYPNGKLKAVTMKDQINDKELETDYDKHGTKRDYAKSCSSCKFYFDADKPVATPDKVYVQ